MLSDDFSQIFREEHRQVRDTLIEMESAFEAHDAEAVGGLLTKTAVLTGPHFRYEEESLYPLLGKVFTPEYIDELLSAHDLIIGRAGRLIELAGSEEITDSVASEAKEHIRQILPHVSDCDGLSIMVETLPEDEVKSIFDCRADALEENLDLVAWSSEVRPRPAVAPN